MTLKIYSLIVLAALTTGQALAVTAPESGKTYKIKHFSGQYLSYAADDTSSVLILADRDDADDNQKFLIENVDGSTTLFTLNVGEGSFVGADAKWHAVNLTDPTDKYAQFSFTESTKYPGYVTIKNQGNKFLGNDPDKEDKMHVWTDKSGSADAHVWKLIDPDSPEPTAIAFNEAEVTLGIYQSGTVSVTLVPANANAAVDFVSSDPTKVTVNDMGKVFAKDFGEVTIIAKAGEVTASCKVTVTPKEDNYPQLAEDDPRNVYPGYNLVFAEEFNGSGSPSSDIWNFENGYKRNNENQHYHADNCTLAGGNLVITARKEKRDFSGQTSTYTSGSMISKSKWNGGYSWKYGIYEVRARVPVYLGCWPAIWSTGCQYEWPYGGEIDIMEYYPSGDKTQANEAIHANVAWGNGSRWGANWNSKVKKISAMADKNWGDNFHVWKMEWDYDYIILSCDDEVINKIDLSTTYNTVPSESFDHGNGCNPFRDVRQNVWVNLALGGNNGGSLDNTPFPCYYLVDYVRIYQKPGIDNQATYHVDSLEETESVDDLEAYVSQPRAYGEEGSISLYGDCGDCGVRIYNIGGSLVSAGQVSLHGSATAASGLSKGLYLVTLDGAGPSRAQKVVVR